jgi:hypothetical protein
MSDSTTVRVGQTVTTVIATGTIGPRGPKGDLGDRGPQGAQGERGIPGPAGTATGRPYSTLVVAASDSVATDKENADYICTGTADELVIQEALDQADSLTSSTRTAHGTAGAKVTLLEGYYAGAGDVLSSQGQIELEGVGPGTHLHNMAVNLQAQGAVRKLLIEATPTYFGVYLSDDGAECSDLWLKGMTADYGVYGSSDRQGIRRVRVEDFIGDYPLYLGGQLSKAIDNFLKGCTGQYGIYNSGLSNIISLNILEALAVNHGIYSTGLKGIITSNSLPNDANTFADESIAVYGNDGIVVGNTLGEGAVLLNAGTGNKVAHNPGVPDSQINQAILGSDGDLLVAVGNGRWRVVGPQTVLGVYISVGTAPVGADVIVDVNQNGTTLFTTPTNRPTIPDGAHTSSLAVPDTVTLADGDYITVDVDQVGSTTPGSDLTVQILFA